jgi:hypothetical protein
MKMTDQSKIAVKGIYSALAAAQMEMGPLIKDAVNPAFKGEGKPKGTAYATLSSVIETCMPTLNKHGICVIQPICDEDGKRYVKTILAHECGDTLECRTELILGKNDMQGYGSAVTYARRFGLMAMAGIAPEDDDGNAAAQSAPKHEPRHDAMRNEGSAKIAAVDSEGVSIAVRSLSDAESMSALAAIFNELPKSIKASPLVIKAKDKRKKDLSTLFVDIGGYEIPY